MMTRRKITAAQSGFATSKAKSSAQRQPGLDRSSWENLRLFLAVAEAGSFRSAAGVVGISINTIRSKVDQLERQLGARLLRRSVEGVVPTREGDEIVQIASDMRAVSRTLARVTPPASDARAERVRMLASDAVGLTWLLPRLIEFQAANPAIAIDLSCATKLPGMLFRDTDIAVQLAPPATAHDTVEPLGVLHLIPFATAAYLQRCGTPASRADAQAHRWVWQDGDAVADEAMPWLAAASQQRPVVAIQTDSAAAQMSAVSNGAGIGFLPSFAGLRDRTLIPLDIGLTMRRDIFAVWHDEADDAGGLAHARSWLREAFDATAFPWFAERFVHPDDFPAPPTADSVVPIGTAVRSDRAGV